VGGLGGVRGICPSRVVPMYPPVIDLNGCRLLEALKSGPTATV